MLDALNVFISYARKDGCDEAERLYDDLTNFHVIAWRDTRDLNPYEDFGGEIERAIERASHVAVIVTPDIRRADSFVRREIAFALAENKPVIPLMFPGGRKPITIINHTHIDFTNWEAGFADLLERLEQGAEPVSLDTRRERELVYLQNIGQRYDHWRDLYTDMAATAHVETARVNVKSGAAARYLELQHDIFSTIESALDDDRSKTITVQGFDELREGIRGHKRVALIGDPGAGKTTTLERLAYELATAAAEDESEPLPLFVRLGAYDGGDFEAFLATSFTGLRLGDYLPGRIFLLLDGLNEMPSEHVPHVEVWLNAHPQVPTVLTCRKLDYVGHKLPLQRIDVTPLDVTRINLFIGNYLENADRDRLFWALGGRDVDRAWEWFSNLQPDASFEDFWFGTVRSVSSWETEKATLKSIQEALRNQNQLPGMLGVVRNPFLLFITIQLYARSGEPPSNKGQLFDQFVHLLMEQRGRPAARTRPPWIDESVQRKALAVLAHRMQADDSGTSVDEDWACAAIQQALPEQDAEQLLYLAASASILDTGTQIRFVHQLLQEYFAAYEMRDNMLRGVPATKYWPDENWWQPTGWEETALLLAGMEGDCSDVVRWLTPVQPTLAYRCATESGAPCSDDAMRELYEPPQGVRVTPLARAKWGHVLAERGDTRAGVSLNPNGLPDIEWCEVPSGPCFIGGDSDTGSSAWQGMEIDLPYTFWIAKFPVTYAQYEAFVADSGYSRPEYWTQAGWKWKAEKTGPRAWDDPFWHIANFPVVGVTWYEAYAFSRWLDAQLRQMSSGPVDTSSDWQIRLPTEAEREKAVRFSDSRKFPWGDTYIPGFANVNEIEEGGPFYLKRTTAVGMYPQGSNPAHGAEDLSGNVWEWCLSVWNKDFQVPEDIQPEGNQSRVVRGGSYRYGIKYARAAYRGGFAPDFRLYGRGFRLVCSVPLV